MASPTSRQTSADDESEGGGRARCASDSGSPPVVAGAAISNRQGIGCETARKIQYDTVGHPCKAECTELGDAQRAGNHDAQGKVGDAGDGLIRQAPTQPSRCGPPTMGVTR